MKYHLLLAAALAAAPTQTAGQGAAPARSGAATQTLTIEVTDRSGAPLADVAVTAAGPVERTASTGQDGSVRLRTMRPGTYRLRFEHPEFVPLEREIVLRSTPTPAISVALTPAPGAPAQPEPPPAAAPATPPAPPPGSTARPRAVAPRVLSIPDFLDRNLIGGEPQRSTLLGCTDGGTARLLQVRDPLTSQQHDEVDEMLYVVAGAGVLRLQDRESKLEPGHFALVPRGVTHSLRREGRNPIILLSIMAGAPCEESEPAATR